MLQILQNLGNGETLLAEVPAPGVRSGCLLIATRASLVSLGTEKMLVDFGKASLLEKARRQPEKVRQVLQKIRTDGLFPTLEAVKAKLDQPLGLGYCNAGVVLEVGAGVTGYAPGDRVVSNGPHAEVVCVPQNLCAKIPDNVSFEDAPFTVVGAIGLQGIRLLAPTLGETVVVTGLGLIGLLCVQMLVAQGCRVLGVDFASDKCALARQFGAETVDLSKGEDPLSAAQALTGGRGVDAVLITASTKSSEPVSQAARMCRKRGRIVLVGVTGLELNRAEFYEKELTFQVSCSYGPGRYDENYEDKGQDYPLGFVRWTEQRNFEAILGLMAADAVKVGPLVSHRYEFSQALEAYQTVSSGRALGIVMRYPEAIAPGVSKPARVVALPKPAPAAVPSVVAAVIGAGNFTGQVLLPALKATGARLHTIVSAGGVTGSHLGKKFGFEHSSTDASALLSDSAVNTVFITTRHNSHARYVIAALRAGKRVYVEKPLCLNHAELDEIRAAHGAAASPFLMVGFNRRFAPQTVKIKSLISANRSPKTLIFTANTGVLPPNHWTLDPAVGGGRIVGEGCHYVDLLRHLAGAPIVAASATYAAGAARDIASIQLSFADGSIGTVHYLSNGSKDFPKERLEVFCGGGILQLDNFRKLTGYGWPGFSKMNLSTQDKGVPAELQAVVQAISKGQPAPIPADEIFEVADWTIKLAQQA